MAKNIRKNVKLIQCPCCETKHALEQEGLIGSAFTCEGCGNDIYCEDEETFIAVANLGNANPAEQNDDAGDEGTEESILVEDSEPEPEPEEPAEDQPKTILG